MTVSALPVQVVQAMARRDHRTHHFLWHALRNSWARLNARQREAILSKFPGWAPPRPARDASGVPSRDNDSGEDFLYMHRQMIAEVDRILASVGDPGYPKVQGWARIPAPDDPDYPVPELDDPDLAELKSAAYYHEVLRRDEERFLDESYLRSVTLGQLGSDLEFQIHNDLHMRWAAPSAVGFRPSSSILQDVDPAWDDPAYDFLGDTYASHVNAIFWKLHGWVDDRIEDWRKAHGLERIEWRGTWMGAQEHHHHHAGPAAARAVEGRSPTSTSRRLQEVADILADAEVFDGFFRPEPSRLAHR